MNENNLEKIKENFTKKIIFLDVDGVLNQGTGGPQRLLLERFKPIVDDKCNIVVTKILSTSHGVTHQENFSITYRLIVVNNIVNS